MWLLAVSDLAGVALIISAVGGILLPFLLPIATKKTRELEARIMDLETQLDECQQERKALERERSRRRR